MPGVSKLWHASQLWHAADFFGSPLDAFTLNLFNSGVFNLFYTIAPFWKVWVQIAPTKPSLS